MSEKDIKKFTKEEMGSWGRGMFFCDLPKDFMRKHLPLFEIHWKKLPFKTNIQCPFCEEGILILIEIKKNICEVHMCHTGDSYTFHCSNRYEKVKCKAFFSYTNRWLYC